MADHIQLDKSSSTCMQPCILIIFSFGHLSGFFGDVSYFFCPQGLVFVQFSRSKSWAKPWWPDFLLIWSHLHLQNLRKIPSEFMFNRKQRPGPHALRSTMQLVPRGDPQDFLGSSPLPQHCSCVESVSTNYHQHSPAHVFQPLMCYLVLHCESTASGRIWQDMASQPGRIRFWSRSSKRVLLCQVSWRKWSSLWTCLSWDLLLGGWAIPVLLTPNVQPSAPLSHREIERGTHLQLHHLQWNLWWRFSEVKSMVKYPKIWSQTSAETSYTWNMGRFPLDMADPN